MTPVERMHDSYVARRRARALANHLAALLPAHASVLDVGCGDGLVPHLVLERRPDLHIRGIDVLVRPVTHVPVEPFDGRTLPAADRSVDAVMFVDVLHHAADPLGLLREGVRVARACLAIKDHLRQGILAAPTLRLMDRVGNARYGVTLPYTYWTPAEWRAAWEQLGLHVVEWRTRLGLYPGPIDWIFGRALHFLARVEVPLSTRRASALTSHDGSAIGPPPA